ncbi:MAG: hypothetical protein WCS01_16430 [bacterium]
MRNQSGLSFVDVLIIVAIVLLLAALAVPRFIKVPDYGNEEDDVPIETTNQTTTAAAPSNTAAEVSE